MDVKVPAAMVADVPGVVARRVGVAYVGAVREFHRLRHQLHRRVVSHELPDHVQLFVGVLLRVGNSTNHIMHSFFFIFYVV